MQEEWTVKPMRLPTTGPEGSNEEVEQITNSNVHRFKKEEDDGHGFLSMRMIIRNLLLLLLLSFLFCCYWDTYLVAYNS